MAKVFKICANERKRVSFVGLPLRSIEKHSKINDFRGSFLTKLSRKPYNFIPLFDSIFQNKLTVHLWEDLFVLLDLNVPFACSSCYAQKSDIQTAENNVRDNKTTRFNANDVTNDLTKTERPRVTNRG